MINLAISLGLGATFFILVSLWLGPVAGVFPGLGVTGISLFLTSRRIGGQVEAEMAEIVPMLQERRIDAAQARLEAIKERYGRWQLLLSGQIDAQLGMIEYLQMHWDRAMPLLQRGKWRNWTALVCIAAIHHRQGRREEAWAALDKAASVGPKEVIIYAIWATLLVRDSQRGEALTVIARGLKAQPDSQVLKELQAKIANKKKIDPKMFGETWYQFFPEDMARKMLTRGRRGGMQQQIPQPRIGARRAPRR